MGECQPSDVSEFGSGALDESCNLNFDAEAPVSSCQLGDDFFFDVQEITVLHSSVLDELDPISYAVTSQNMHIGSDGQSMVQVDAFKQIILARRKRAVLNSKTAEDIYRLGAAVPADSRLSGVAPDPLSRRSVLVSQLYGISPKAVRDIWNR